MSLTLKEINRRLNDSYELANNVIEAVPNPLVSVRTSTYNHKDYIKQCIEGVLMQKTNFQFEFIIGEDFSGDETRKIVFEYAKNYPNIIRVLTADYNVGSKVNGKRCIRASRGKYMAVCEGDDFWTDEYKLQKQIDFLEQNKDYGIVHTEFDTYYQDSDYYLRNTHNVLGINIKDQCSLHYWNLFGKSMATIKMLTVCYRLDYIKKWHDIMPENKWIVGDFPLFFFISLHAKVGYIEGSTSVYRSVSKGSASNVGDDKFKKMMIKKTYVDIRLYFLNQYKLDGGKYNRALVRDLNKLLFYSILNENDEIFKDYFTIYQSLSIKSITFNLVQIYRNTKRPIFKMAVKRVIKVIIFYSDYLVKVFNVKFLIETLKRKIRLNI